MTDSMIERMAKGLWDEQERYLGTRTPWERADPEGGRAITLRLVRAALVVMRVPTEAMLLASCPSGPAIASIVAEARSLIWKAMIDAALKELP